jgi:hypothetical protein
VNFHIRLKRTPAATLPIGHRQLVLVKTRSKNSEPWKFREGYRLEARNTNILVCFQRTFFFIELTWCEWHDASASSPYYEIYWTADPTSPPLR